jgi:hypothetical protein
MTSSSHHMSAARAVNPKHHASLRTGMMVTIFI